MAYQNRVLLFEDKKLKQLLEEKKSYIEKGKKIVEEAEKLDKENNRLLLLVKKTIDKIKPLVDRYVKENGRLQQYEYTQEVFLEDDGKIKITIGDKIEDYKLALDEQARNNLNK